MKRDKQPGPGAIELLEEAVHLLRGAPAGIHALYALGTLPFVLAFLFFWADMSRGAYAREHAGIEALGLALVFLWMKCWQVAFVGELRVRIGGHERTPWTCRRMARMIVAQTALQPIGLFAVPLATVAVLPFGWAYGFFQNVTVLADGSTSLAEASKNSATQASYRGGQSMIALGILSIFATFVWLNVGLFMAMLPNLLKTFLGIDNEYTRAGYHSFFNTTCLACSVALTYLFVDPLAKAAYALRCFYGQSRQTGEDLKTALSRVRAQAAPALLVLLCLTGFVSAAPAQTNVTPPQLNQSIDQVQQEPQFAWRMPREKLDDSDSQQGWIARTLRSVAEAIVDGLKWVAHQIWQLLRWIADAIREWWPHSKSSDASSGAGFDWISLLQVLLVILIIAIVAFLAVLIIRGLQQQRRKMPVVVADIVAARPDLNNENVAADQLPEDGWLALARELMGKGELRLALRALYLAGLAHLAGRQLISVAIFKSNREYETELRRRGRAQPDALTAFSQNVAVFDCVWYGAHGVTTDTLQEFEANLTRIRAC